MLEHLGTQGDYRFFFKQFEDFWRILKKDGLFIASVPGLKSPWLLSDPGHTRVISLQTLGFLNQEYYKQCGETPASDYRFCYNADFNLAEYKYYHQDWLFVFVLQKVYPVRRVK